MAITKNLHHLFNKIYNCSINQINGLEDYKARNLLQHHISHQHPLQVLLYPAPKHEESYWTADPQDRRTNHARTLHQTEVLRGQHTPAKNHISPQISAAFDTENPTERSLNAQSRIRCFSSRSTASATDHRVARKIESSRSKEPLGDLVGKKKNEPRRIPTLESWHFFFAQPQPRGKCASSYHRFATSWAAEQVRCRRRCE